MSGYKTPKRKIGTPNPATTGLRLDRKTDKLVTRYLFSIIKIISFL